MDFFLLFGYKRITEVYSTILFILYYLPLRKFGIWIYGFDDFEVVLEAEQEEWTTEKSKYC